MFLPSTPVFFSLPVAKAVKTWESPPHRLGESPTACGRLFLSRNSGSPRATGSPTATKDSRLRAPAFRHGGCKPGGPQGPREHHSVPVSCLSGRIETYGTARRTQDIQVPTDANT